MSSLAKVEGGGGDGVIVAGETRETHNNEKSSRQGVSELVDTEKHLNAWQAAKKYKRIMGYCMFSKLTISTHINSVS